MEEWFDHRRVRRVRDRRHPLARRLRGRRPAGRARAAAARRVPRPLHRHDPARHTSAWNGPSRGRPWPDATTAGPLDGPARRRGRHPGRRTDGRHRARRVRRRGHQGRAARHRRSHADVGQPQATASAWSGRASAATSDASRSTSARPRARSCSTSCSTSATCSSSATGRARSSGGGSTTSRSTPAHPRLVMLHITGYGKGGPTSDRPGYGTLAEAMSGFAQLTGQPDGPPTLPPFMLADGVAVAGGHVAVMMALYHRDVHGGDGQLIDVNLIEPLARLIEIVDARLRPARHQPRPGRQPPRRQRAPQRLPHRRRPLAGDLQRVAEHRRAGLPGHRPARPGRGPRLRRPGPAPGPRRRGRRARGRLGRAQRTLDEAMTVFARPRSPPRRSTTPSSCSPTSTSAPAAPSSSRRPRPRVR